MHVITMPFSMPNKILSVCKMPFMLILVAISSAKNFTSASTNYPKLQVGKSPLTKSSPTFSNTFASVNSLIIINLH